MDHAASSDPAGFQFVPVNSSVGGSFSFRVTGPDGRPVTAFDPDQTKLMHFYLIRTDLTGFQHVHPTMAPDGTWTAPLTTAQPGSYRAYASFIAGKKPLVLSQHVSVPGTSTLAALPPASTTTQVDGYTLTLDSAQLMAGMNHDLTVTVTRDGQPANDLQPYLDTFAHLTAFREGDQAFAHLHPRGRADNVLTVEAMLPKAGQWRLFIQFQTNDTLHTAAVTVSVS